MGHAHETRGKGAVLCIALILTTRRQGRDGGAMIVALAVENLVLFTAIPLVRDLADHLEALFVRLRAGVAIVDARHARHLVNQHFGKVRAGDRASRTCKVVQFYQLVAHRVGDPFAAIADVDGPDTAGHGVQMLFALLVPDAHAFAFDNDARVSGFVGFVLAQVVPDVGAIHLDNVREVVLIKFSVHGSDLSNQAVSGEFRV